MQHTYHDSIYLIPKFRNFLMLEICTYIIRHCVVNLHGSYRLSSNLDTPRFQKAF